MRRTTPTLLIAVVAATSTLRWVSHSGGSRPEPPVEFSRAEIKIELNATAQDAGIQMLIDGEGWERVRVTSPDGERELRIRADGSVGDIGVTELFFESAEPSLADLPLDELLAMFPEGEYEVVGRTVEGVDMVGTATLTHDIPAGPDVVSPPTDSITDPANTVVAWEPVTEPPGIEIRGYQVIVEREDPLRIFSVDLPASATSVTVPAEFLEPGTDYNLEVIAIAEGGGGNQTITESTFSTAG